MDIEIDHDNGIILVDANVFDPDDAMPLLAAMREAGEGNGYDYLVDRSRPETGPIAWASIQRANKLVDELSFFRDRRIAGVVPPGVRYAVARQIAAMAAALRVADYRPFTQRSEALAWLKGSEDQPY